jgi:hypothetical protein
MGILEFLGVGFGFFAVIASNAALFFWSRSESREDTRRIEGLVEAIKDEIKDFHGRLCAIESNRIVLKKNRKE